MVGALEDQLDGIVEESGLLEDRPQGGAGPLGRPDRLREPRLAQGARVQSSRPLPAHSIVVAAVTAGRLRNPAMDRLSSRADTTPDRQRPPGGVSRRDVEMDQQECRPTGVTS